MSEYEEFKKLVQERGACKECGAVAEVNVQKTWIVYEIDANTGKYSEGIVDYDLEDPVGEFLAILDIVADIEPYTEKS